MFGFVNGLAIVIFMAQLAQFKFTDTSGIEHWLGGQALMVMLGFVGLTMAIIYLMPRLTKAPSKAAAGTMAISAGLT